MNKDLWFPTAVWWNKLTDLSNHDLEEIKAFCLSLKNSDPGVKLSNIGGWQSKDFIKEELHGCVAFGRLLILVENAVDQIKKEYGVSNIRLDNFWVNINKSNDYNEAHWHPGGFLSAVFYVTPKPSKIVLFRPGELELFWLESNFSNLSTPLSFKSAEYSMEEKSLLVFPSYLNHKVMQNDQSHDRISIALNFKSF